MIIQNITIAQKALMKKRILLRLSCGCFLGNVIPQCWQLALLISFSPWQKRHFLLVSFIIKSIRLIEKLIDDITEVNVKVIAQVLK